MRFMVREIKEKRKLSHEPTVDRIPAGAYPGFCSMRRLGVLLLLLDGMLVYRRYPPPPPSISSGFSDSSLVPIYTPGWREALRE